MAGPGCQVQNLLLSFHDEERVEGGRGGNRVKMNISCFIFRVENIRKYWKKILLVFLFSKFFYSGK
jgi:hypothetical protein